MKHIHEAKGVIEVEVDGVEEVLFQFFGNNYEALRGVKKEEDLRAYFDSLHQSTRWVGGVPLDYGIKIVTVVNRMAAVKYVRQATDPVFKVVYH